MRRTTAAGVLVTALLTLGTTGTANAADLNCDDFPNQAAAQAALLADPSDPNNLDGNDDGEACENHTYAPSASSSTGTSTGTSTGASQVSTRPTGAVAAGDGSASEDGSALPFVLGGAALAAAGGAAVAARRSSRASA